MKAIFDFKKVLVSILILFVGNSSVYAESFDSDERIPTAIYHLYSNDGHHYIGQVRRKGLEIDKMIEKRANEHSEFSGYSDEWWFEPLATSESRDIANSAGWTRLEASINEQAYIYDYCKQAINEKKKILNARNEISQDVIIKYWESSKSNINNIVKIAKNTEGEPIAKTIPEEWGCLTK